MSVQDLDDTQAVRRSPRSTRCRHDDLDDVLCSGNEQTESGSTSLASGIRTANVPVSTDDSASVGEVTANPRIHNFCPICKVEVQETTNSVECGSCHTETHQTCLHMNDEEYNAISNAAEVSHWYCAHCRLVKANNIKWVQHSGEVHSLLDYVNIQDNYWIEKELISPSKREMWVGLRKRVNTTVESTSR